MADDERRAEIEAVAAALRDWHWDESGDFERSAADVIRRLDRVRDARGNDERCARENCFVPDTGCVMGFDAESCPHRSPSRDGTVADGLSYEERVELRASQLAEARWKGRNQELVAELAAARDGTVAVEAILDRIIGAASRAGADGVLPAETVRAECLRVTYALHGGDVADDVRVGDDRLAGQASEGAASEAFLDEGLDGGEAGLGLGLVGASDVDGESKVGDEAGLSGAGHGANHTADGMEYKGYPAGEPLTSKIAEAVFTYLNDCIIGHREPWDEGGLYNVIEEAFSRVSHDGTVAVEDVRPFVVGAMREARAVLESESDEAAKARALRLLNDALGRLSRPAEFSPASTGDREENDKRRP